MATTNKIYADLDLTFKKIPATGDLALRYDDQAVIGSVRNLLLTNFYERPFSPLVGSNLSKLLFEPATNITASLIADEIQNTISNYEPRVNVLGVEVLPTNNGNGFNVTLTFFIGNNTLPTTVNLLLQRSR